MLPGCAHGTCNKSFECKCKHGWQGIFCTLGKPSMKSIWPGRICVTCRQPIRTASLEKSSSHQFRRFVFISDVMFYLVRATTALLRSRVLVSAYHSPSVVMSNQPCARKDVTRVAAIVKCLANAGIITSYTCLSKFSFGKVSLDSSQHCA